MGLSNIELRAVAGEIKKLVPFREAAERYGLEFDRSGFCRCPFHNERTASFRAYPDSGHCFGCGWDGDIFDLVGGLLGISFRDTVSRVNDDLGLGYPTDRRATLRERAELSARARALVKAREAEKASACRRTGEGIRPKFLRFPRRRRCWHADNRHRSRLSRCRPQFQWTARL